MLTTDEIHRAALSILNRWQATMDDPDDPHVEVRRADLETLRAALENRGEQHYPISGTVDSITERHAPRRQVERQGEQPTAAVLADIRRHIGPGPTDVYHWPPSMDTVRRWAAMLEQGEQVPRCKRCNDTGYYNPDKHHGQVQEWCGCGQGEQPLRGRYHDSLQPSDAVVEQRRQEREQAPRRYDESEIQAAIWAVLSQMVWFRWMVSPVNIDWLQNAVVARLQGEGNPPPHPDGFTPLPQDMTTSTDPRNAERPTSVEDKIHHYFATVSDEQFMADCREAGFRFASDGQRVPPQPSTRLTHIPLQITSPGGEVHGIQLVAVDAAALEALEARIGRVQPPTQQTDLPDDPVAAALVESMRLDNQFVDCGVGQALREELGENDSGEENYYKHRDILVRAAFTLVRWHHARVMAVLDELREAQSVTHTAQYSAGYSAALSDVRFKVQALTPPGGDTDGD